VELNNYEVKVFKTIIDANGFQKASEVLYVTQSAVSQSLSNLESKLGQPLIIRKNPLRLTEAGKRLMKYAHNVLSTEREMLAELENIKKGIDVTLSIAINSTVNRYYASSLLLTFCQQHPSARLSVDVFPSREIIYVVLQGKRELGFGPFQKQMAAFETVPLFETKSHLVVSKNHPQYLQLLKTPQKAFRKIPLLTSFLDQSELRPSAEKIRDYFATVWEVNSETLRLAMINDGLGVTFVGSRLLEEEDVAQGLAIIDRSPFATIERTVGIYYKKGTDLSDGARHLIQICRDRWPREMGTST
jgi:DNA-binding transcriptional LysR family regulator|tara:strand:- start:597 stop:1502 length:906 start_codon:yes stop_codon:yes gene_type:complete